MRFPKFMRPGWGELFGSQWDVASWWCFFSLAASMLPAKYALLIVLYMVFLVVINSIDALSQKNSLKGSSWCAGDCLCCCFGCRLFGWSCWCRCLLIALVLLVVLLVLGVDALTCLTSRMRGDVRRIMQLHDGTWWHRGRARWSRSFCRCFAGAGDVLLVAHVAKTCTKKSELLALSHPKWRLSPPRRGRLSGPASGAGAHHRQVRSHHGRTF